MICSAFEGYFIKQILIQLCLVSDDGTPDHNSLISGKPAALLVTCAGPIEGNCDPIRGVFKGFADYFQLTEKGSYILPFCTTPDAIGDNGDELAKSLADAITE